MSKIWSKLFIAFILITMVTVSAVGWLLNFSFQSKFAEYVQANLDEKHQNLILYIETQIDNETLPEILFMNLSHFSAMENVRIQILQPTGELFFDSIYSEFLMRPFPERRRLQGDSPPYVTTKQIPIDDGELIVRVISELGDGFWSPEDLTFRQAIYYSLLASLELVYFSP